MAIHDLNLGSRYSDRMIMLNRGFITAAGSPFSVLTKDNILEVYGVEAVVRDEDGFPYVVPKSPIKNNGGTLLS
jgi:iron complex transport system ATP-binding protein